MTAAMIKCLLRHCDTPSIGIWIQCGANKSYNRVESNKKSVFCSLFYCFWKYTATHELFWSCRSLVNIKKKNIYLSRRVSGNWQLFLIMFKCIEVWNQYWFNYILRWTSSKCGSYFRYTIGDLHKSKITAIEWSKNGMRLFSGDKKGVIIMTEIDFYMVSKI